MPCVVELGNEMNPIFHSDVSLPTSRSFLRLSRWSSTSATFSSWSTRSGREKRSRKRLRKTSSANKQFTRCHAQQPVTHSTELADTLYIDSPSLLFNSSLFKKKVHTGSMDSFVFKLGDMHAGIANIILFFFSFFQIVWKSLNYYGQLMLFLFVHHHNCTLP